MLTPEGRLRTLAQFLATKVPLKRFTLHDWVSWLPMPGTEVVRTRAINLMTDVGYLGDALGWAASCPELIFEGLTLAVFSNAPMFWRPGATEPLTGWPAVLEFFGLNMDQAHYLFGVMSYTVDPRPTVVAARIHVFLETIARTTAVDDDD
jgi:hypothetical protein